MRFGEVGSVDCVHKIGYTRHLEARLNTLRKEYPDATLSAYFRVHGDRKYAKRMERNMHRQLSKFRIKATPRGRELFHLDDDGLTTVRQMMGKLIDLYGGWMRETKEVGND